MMYLWTYGRQKTWLHKRLKSPVSDDPLKGDMVNGPKQSWNMNDSTFTLFIHHYEGNSGWKTPSWWYAKS